MTRANKRPSLSPDLLPTMGECTGNEERLIELLLDITSCLQATESYIAQWEDTDNEQVMRSESALMRSPRAATHNRGNNSELATREGDGS